MKLDEKKALAAKMFQSYLDGVSEGDSFEMHISSETSTVYDQTTNTHSAGPHTSMTIKMNHTKAAAK